LRPLWSATFVTGLADGGVGLVLVVNHVLTDGVAGLAALAAVMDPRSEPAASGERDNGETSPAQRSSSRAGLRRLRQGVAELGGARPPARLTRTSLNRPTGPRRRLDVVSTDLAAVREFAHARGGTVNDVLLAVVAGALRELLASRGEQLRQLGVSVVVSARTAADDGDLGNKVGLMFVTVPADGDLGNRVGRIAAMTRARKSSAAGASAALFVPGFLLLARVGLLRWFVNHQRRINTFVTNMRGPWEPTAFAGARVREMIAIPATTGNVTMTFAALSYAGTLRITVLSDPSRVPDAPVLTKALRQGLDGIT
jgi:diacylglycerol O-acyltransferase / wax synthase